MTITSPAGASTTCPTVAVAFQTNVPPPSTTRCRVDSGAFAPCTSGAQFQGLAAGAHSITVAVFNNGGHMQAQRTVSFTVLAVAPVITIDTPLDDPSFTTGKSGPITGTVTDSSPLDSIVAIGCTIDGTTACGGSANPAAGTFAFTFDGLLDQFGGGTATHTVAIDVQDRCSAQGATVDVPATRTATWHVDSTPSQITFRDFDPPFVAAGGPGPQNDITAHANQVNFRLTDPPGDAPFDTLAVTLDNGQHAQVNCMPAGPMQLDCSAGFIGLASGSHTATVSVVDPASNAAEAALVWQVDDTPPTLTFFDVGTNGCTTNAGRSLTRATGSVQFAMIDDLSGVAQATCSLDAGIGGGLFVPVGPASDCTSGSFAFANLADGNYRLTVVVSDVVGNLWTAANEFAVDGTGPVVTYVSPAGGDIVAPDVTPVGSFTTVADAATQPPQFTCTIDGLAVPCDPTSGYDLAVLAEGSHTLQISGTDCVGNTSVAPAIPFQVDRNAPIHNVALAQQDSDGNAMFEINATDAITNIEHIDCELDGPSGSTPGIPCAVVGLPTVIGAKSFVGLLAVSELSPGLHILRTRAADYWGHTGFVQEFTFQVTYPSDAPGHLFVIGRDFEEEGAGTPAGNVLGNAVFASRARSFSRPMRIALADPTNSATELAAQQVEAAICQRIEDRRGDCSCSLGECITVTHSTGFAIADTLLGQDAIVFLDQHDPAAVEALTNAAFVAALQQFANSGGIVVVTNGVDPDGVPTNTFALLRGLVDLTLVDSAADPAAASRMCESLDPTTFDTSSTTFIDDLPASTHGVRFAHTAVDLIDVYTSPGADNTTRPVVIDKYMPQRVDRGPVYVRAFDDEANPITGLAVFYKPGDLASVTCEIQSDGRVSREIEAGTIVTVENHGTLLQTLFDLVPYEQVTIGRSTPLATPSTVDVSWPAVMGATQYTVSTGCDTITVAAPALTATVAYSTDCEVGGYGVAFTAGLPTVVFATGFATFGEGATNVDLTSWTLRSPSNMFDVSVAATPAFDPSTDPFVAATRTSFALARGNVLFGASVPAIGAAASGAVPNPNPFWTGRATLALDFETGDSSTVTIAALASTAIQATAFLPRLTALVVTGSASERTIVFGTSTSIWAGAAITPLTAAAADGLQVSMQTASGTCGAPMEWRFSLAPPSSSAFALPPLGDIPCAPDDTNAMFTGILFSSDGRTAAHRAMQDTIDKLDRPVARPPGAVTRESRY